MIQLPDFLKFSSDLAQASIRCMIIVNCTCSEYTRLNGQLCNDG